MIGSLQVFWGWAVEVKQVQRNRGDRDAVLRRLFSHKFVNTPNPAVPTGFRGSMTEFGKLLIILGVVLIAAGLLLTLFGRFHLPVGRLPGDIVYRGKNTTFYFPLATSILLSVLLTLVLYVIGRWKR